MLDTDCKEVGCPMIEFVNPWVQSHYKMTDQLPEGVGQKILDIFEIVLKRVAFPKWCELEIEPDDLQNDYDKYREILKVLLRNISLIKPIRQ